MNWRFAIGIIALLVLVSCGKDEEPGRVDLGLAYFPVNKGTYVDYQVDSVHVDEQGGFPTYRITYEMRELIAEDFVDPEGRLSQRIERYVKDSLDEWVIRDVWYQHRSQSVAERVEENVRRIRMVFRPEVSKEWDLNALNPESALEMTFEEIDKPALLNGFNFDSTLVVNTTYTNNLVDTIINMERFAKHIGVVEKKWVETNSQYDSPSQSWQTTGFRVNYRLLGYGEL
jgi:hypothetical protein